MSFVSPPDGTARGFGGNAGTDMAVHRVIEGRAFSHGDTIAIVGSSVTLSYRELNQRANAIARTLIAHGFHRAGLATVRMPRSPEAAMALLGVLKAGGMFMLIDDEDAGATWPRGLSFAESEARSERDERNERRWRTVDVADAFERPSTSSANLPIIARATDVACVIPDRDGSPLVLVPHSTIISLVGKPVPRFAEWSGEPGALDLWMALMAGATVTIAPGALATAAA